MQTLEWTPPYEVTQLVDKNGKPRRYIIESEDAEDTPVPSVTTVLKMLDKPALPPAAWKVACQGVAVLSNDGYTFPTEPKEVEDLLKERGWASWQAWGRAAKRGTKMHEALEALVTQDEIPNLTSYSDEEQGYLRALARWYSETGPEMLLTEVKVGSREHGFAGRFDYVRRCDGQVGSEPLDCGCRGEGIILGDLKTGKPDDAGLAREPYPEHYLQVAGYELAWREMNGQAPCAQEIVYAVSNGQYQAWVGLADPEDFLCLLPAFNRYRNLEKKIKAYHKGRKDGDTQADVVSE